VIPHPSPECCVVGRRTTRSYEVWWVSWSPTLLGFRLVLSKLLVDVQGEVMGRHSLVLQSEGGQFPSINVGLVYLQNVQRGSAALWVIQEVRSAIPNALRWALTGGYRQASPLATQMPVCALPAFAAIRRHAPCRRLDELFTRGALRTTRDGFASVGPRV
jgi:hypothetical protein